MKINEYCRLLLEQEEQSIDQLELKLDKILKVCGNMIDTGKTYVGQQRFVLKCFVTIIIVIGTF